MSKLKSNNIYQKRKESGSLPEGYPENMIKNAKKNRENKENWKNLMSYPTEIWRFCVYPVFKMNYINWCNNLYLTKSKNEKKCKIKYKNKACFYSFCNVCCDNIQYELINISQNDIIGDLLELKSESGEKEIKSAVDLNEIKKCKLSCKKNYYTEMPIILPPPPLDRLLGKSSDNPAFSCADIMKWGE